MYAYVNGNWNFSSFQFSSEREREREMYFMDHNNEISLYHNKINIILFITSYKQCSNSPMTYFSLDISTQAAHTHTHTHRETCPLTHVNVSYNTDLVLPGNDPLSKVKWDDWGSGKYVSFEVYYCQSVIILKLYFELKLNCSVANHKTRGPWFKYTIF